LKTNKNLILPYIIYSRGPFLPYALFVEHFIIVVSMLDQICSLLPTTWSYIGTVLCSCNKY